MMLQPFDNELIVSDLKEAEQDTFSIVSLHDSIATLFLEKLNIEVASVETDLMGTGALDSLALVELLLHLEQQFRFKIPLENLDLEHFRSIAGIAKFIASSNGDGHYNNGLGDSPDPFRSNPMGHVRPFIEKDISQVADLHSRIFRTGDSSSAQLQQSYRSYFSQIFLNSPWSDSTMPSLVYEEVNGNIVGFLGVQPRRMSMNGRPVRAAVSSQFIVDPACRSTLAGLQLLRVFFAGPQDLSIADEANDTSRKLWEGHGGITALLHSLYWLRLLRPAQFLLARFCQGKFPDSVMRSFASLCRFIDVIGARMPLSPFRQPECGAIGEELSRETLGSCLSEFSRSWPLRAEYNDHSLEWLMDVLAENRTPGSLQKIAVRNMDGKAIGWYLYHLTPGGLGEVLQLGAKPGSMTLVLDHLFHHALRKGATALSGRIEPRFMHEFWAKSAVFQYRGYWMLLHSRRPELLETIQNGNAFLSRLEGEWCMRFCQNLGATPSRPGRTPIAEAPRLYPTESAAGN